MPEESRPSWTSTWMDIAVSLGERSRCSRAHVGAVVVTADNRVAAVGYNGPPRGLMVSGDCSHWCPRARGVGGTGSNYAACESIHAETNAITRADYTDISGGTVYVSRAMCIGCARLVGNSGLRHVVHRVVPEDAHRDPDGVEAYLRKIGLSVKRVAE